MNQLTEETIKQVRHTDWYFDMISGDLQRYLKEARNYKHTVNQLAVLESAITTSLVNTYVPTDLRPQVLKDIEKARQDVQI